MDRGVGGIRLTLWGLLSLWMFFGCLELVDESRIIPTLTENAQEGEDLDEAALTQLASGLKSDRSHLESPHSHSIQHTIFQPVVSVSTDLIQPCAQLVRHGPPTLPIYQQLSVYRI